MKDKVTEILLALDDCSSCGVNLLYIPHATVGVIIAHAMALRFDITSLESQVERLQKQIDEGKKGMMG